MSAPPQKPSARLDCDEIRRALALFLPPGQVTEIRVLHGREKPDGFAEVNIGYFDDPAKVAEALTRLRGGWSGVYFLPQPVDPELLARGLNRLRSGKETSETTDANVLRRKWLLLDVDPKRPSGISATDAEREAARQTAAQIREAVTEHGFPPPVVASSGNGWHLMWRVDLEADSPLPERFLKAVAAQYDSPSVTIDLTVFNPARIWRLYGALNCKGEDMPLRPHRVARLEEVPAVMEVLSPVAIEETCALWAPGSAASDKGEAAQSGTGDKTAQRAAVKRAEKLGLQLGAAKPLGDGGALYVLKTCPCSRKETDGKAYLSVASGGALGLGCRRASCEFSRGKSKPGENWTRFRMAHDPIGEVDGGAGGDLGEPAALVRVDIKMLPDRLDLTLEAAVAALAAGDPDLFQRGESLVQITRGGLGGAVAIRELPAVVLLEKTARVARFLEHVPSKTANPAYWKPVRLPRAIADGIHARGEWSGIRRLTGISAVPILAPDGSIRDVPGYDPATMQYFHTVVTFPPIPASPTLEEAQAALAMLAAPFADFPFENQTHRSAAIAAILAGVARTCLDGPIPGFLVEANVRSSGKSLLANCLAFIVSGEIVASAGFPEQEEERVKVFVSELRRGKPVMLFDDVAGGIGGAALNRLLTTTLFSDRLLGSSTIFAAPVRQVILFTANNPTIVGDTLRRLLPIRLVTLCERPEDRSDFAIPNLAKYVREHRPALVSAALTVMRAWIVAGSPDMGLEPWGSFEAFQPVRNALVWAGWPDPIAARAALRSEESESLLPLKEFLEALFEATADKGEPLYAKEIADHAAKLGTDGRAATRLGRAYLALPGKPSLPVDARAVGYRLKKVKDRVVGGLRLAVGESDRLGVPYSVSHVGSAVRAPEPRRDDVMK